VQGSGTFFLQPDGGLQIFNDCHVAEQEFVQEIIEGKFREGQLNESTLTLRGLMKISIAFRRYITGVFHSRIEYPDDKDIEKKEEKA